MDPSQERRNGRPGIEANLAALSITLFGFVARLWMASGIFLNPDEALHFRLANQVSLGLAYRNSLTASHPPLLTMVLYFWRWVGTSDLCLRLPSVFAGVAFCWMFYKWLEHSTGSVVALTGLVFVALLPPLVVLGAEIRQYSLLLAFLASSLYFLQDAFAKNSATRMAAFSVCLCLSMMSHYSAFLFAAALGIYALSKFLAERIPVAVMMAWAGGQLGALALAIFLYKTHISKLGAGEATTALQGWMGDSFLRHSYYDPANGKLLSFLAGHTVGMFQYFFGQLAVGDVMCLFFLLGVAVLLRDKEFRNGKGNGRRLGLFLLASFALAACANLARVYPYGGTRHMAFLIIPAVAGISVAMERIAGRWGRSLALAAFVLVACVAFGKPRQPYMDRADQSHAHMDAALDFVEAKIGPSDLILTDYQTDLILGHYLCRQKTIFFDAAPKGFEQFSCSGHRVVSLDFREWIFWANNFIPEWKRFVEVYRLNPGDTVWIVQAGWGIGLPEDLRYRYAEFHNLDFASFGKNIKIFRMTVSQPLPANGL